MLNANWRLRILLAIADWGLARNRRSSIRDTICNPKQGIRDDD